MFACLLSRRDCRLYWNRLAQGRMSCIIIAKTVLICLAEKAPALILDLYLHSFFVFFPPVPLAHTHTCTAEKGQWSVWTLVWGLVVELPGSQQLPDGQWRPWEFRKNPSKCSSVSGSVIRCRAVYISVSVMVKKWLISAGVAIEELTSCKGAIQDLMIFFCSFQSSSSHFSIFPP